MLVGFRGLCARPFLPLSGCGTGLPCVVRPEDGTGLESAGEGGAKVVLAVVGVEHRERLLGQRRGHA